MKRFVRSYGGMDENQYGAFVLYDDAHAEIARQRAKLAEAAKWHSEVVNQWTNHFEPESDWSQMVSDALRQLGNVLEKDKKEP